uniref:Predicted protein n=1 Tax=Hordeum vulgare subsp. vulgare TaxID=112509 RepID=F2D9B3_HORVV|nr:predicted protein [Hordeum vulgare subsp. vulgare]
MLHRVLRSVMFARPDACLSTCYVLCSQTQSCIQRPVPFLFLLNDDLEI